MLAKLLIAASLAATGLCALEAQTVWGQCGGRQWRGPTACQTGLMCTFGNDWYSQCVYGTNGQPQQQGGANGGGTGTGTSDQDADDSDDSDSDSTDPDDDSDDSATSSSARVVAQSTQNTGGRVITRTITTVYSVGPKSTSAARVTSITRKAKTTVRNTTRRSSSARSTTTSLVPDVPSDDGDDSGN